MNEHTAIPPADESLAASLGLDVYMFAIQFLNFVVVGLIIWFLILRPLTKKMAERKKLIDESLEKAEAIDANFRVAEQKAREILDDAKVKANHVVSQAQDEAVVVGEKTKAQARVEIDELVAEAKKHIQDERETARADLQREVADLVATATEKIIAVKLDSTSDEKLIMSTLKDLSKSENAA